MTKNRKVVPWYRLAFKIFLRNTVKKNADKKDNVFKTPVNKNTVSYLPEPQPPKEQTLRKE